MSHCAAFGALLSGFVAASPAKCDSPRLSDIVPPGLVDRDGVVLVMVGRKGCGASADFKPTFLSELVVPEGVEKVYVERPASAEALKYYPTPGFVLFRNRVPVDFRTGAVHSSNSFARKANNEIFSAFLVRNGLAPGTEWSLAVNKFDDSKALDYRSLQFINATGASLAGYSFKRALLSEVMLDEADFGDATFEYTVFAHVSLAGAKLSPQQASAIVWVNSVCPDGTKSSSHGDSCVEHLAVTRAPAAARKVAAPRAATDERQ